MSTEKSLENFITQMQTAWVDSLQKVAAAYSIEQTTQIPHLLQEATRTKLESALTQKPVLLSINGPGAIGKGTVINSILSKNSNLVRVLNTTTRKARHTEASGIDYHFVDNDTFERLAENNLLATRKFREGRGWYGFQREHVANALRSGDCLVEESADVIKELFAVVGGTVSKVFIYLLPPEPCFDLLYQRLTHRMKTSGEEPTLEALQSTLGRRQLSEFEQTSDLPQTCYLVNDDSIKTAEYLNSLLLQSV